LQVAMNIDYTTMICPVSCWSHWCWFHCRFQCNYLRFCSRTCSTDVWLTTLHHLTAMLSLWNFTFRPFIRPQCFINRIVCSLWFLPWSRRAMLANDKSMLIEQQFLRKFGISCGSEWSSYDWLHVHDH
jgi:hypothetical protein